MKRESDTKERIEQISLDLFAKYGYNAVSIRDICKQLGFTESSIYYHFKNKQAIMDAMLQKIEVLIEEKIKIFDERLEQATKVTEVEVSQVAVGFLTLYYLNPYVFKIISMLTLERMSDIHAYEVYQRIVFDLPLTQQEKVFGQMQERGFVKDGNPRIMAEQYLSIIYFSFQRHCIGRELEDGITTEIITEVDASIRDFFLKIKR